MTAIPETMKAAIATGFGAIDENVFLNQGWKTPKFDSTDDIFSNRMVIKVFACALAPGDPRLLSGKTSYVQLPKSGLPYIIGSDSCGKVIQVHEKETKFKVGDIVVSRFDGIHPVEGLAEYRITETKFCEIAPKTISPITACGLPASGMAAKILARDHINKNDRVLILGGSGGVGTILCQYAKLYGASYIAATSTQNELLTTKLGVVDTVIDYRKTNWWETPEFQKNKFDVVFDLVNGKNWQRGGQSGLAVKRNGKYVALLTGVETEVVVQGPWDLVRLSFEFIWLFLWSRINPTIPKWVAPDGLELKEGDLKSLFEDVDSGRIVPILDPASPFPFTQDGIRKAMALQKSIHAHGKVVVEVSKE